jgi:uncharacterized protein
MTGFPKHTSDPSLSLPPDLQAPGGSENGDPPQLQRDDGLLFKQFFMPPPPPQERIPHLGHVGLLLLLGLTALLSSILLARVGVHFHLFGVTTVEKASADVHYTLATEGIFYLLTFVGALLLFPALWGKSFFAGLQWRAGAAMRRSGYLFGAALACFGLALVNGLLMPGPNDTPIDKIFRTPGAAWILFAFGVTFAPFFEEIAFRGFLLPALCTVFDWSVERSTGHLPRPLHRNGHPRWSMPAMVASSLASSLLFALLHADQTGYSIGPFLLLVCVSLVLCTIRLATRSLAASVVVHACYNFLLFTLMFLGTSGFKHLDKM